MRALSVRQPWAWAIAYAGKTVENRSRRFNHEGLVAIHASLGLDEPGFFPRNEAGHTAARKLDALGGRSNFWDADCHAKCSPWAIDGQWHICLDDVRPLAEPVPARGKLGLWTVPEDVESAVRAQIEVSTNG